ncbi:MAG: hypothetical protein L6R40_005926 [Gallowayella cf. fulva]|nr:MAG: hypothetical protein L6R40_005926 [Xanthomendoza cf. fulva]
MSLDLLQEFGNPTRSEFTTPWASSSGQSKPTNESAEEDDFGDFQQPGLFEKPEKGHKPRDTLSVPTAQNHNALLIDVEPIKPPQSPSFQELNAPLKLAIPQKRSHGTSVDTKTDNSTPITAWPSYGRDRVESFGKPLPLSPYTEDGDDWGDFQEEPHAEIDKSEPGKQVGSLVHLSAEQEVGQASSLSNLIDTIETSVPPATPAQKSVKLSITGPAPSNIPPPSILLSTISTLLGCLPEEFRVIVSSISASLMTGAFPPQDPLFDLLIGKLAVTNASARILAGRKLRWKRDKHLAQRMSIGPANAGKTGGMKLTGVDRTESRREDQEAAEVVRTWKQHSGGLKSNVAKLNAQQSEVKFALPEIADNIPIRVAKPGEGGFGAAKCCFLCGLRRNERIARVDIDVQDSFGEWWVDHWGHVHCVLFWEEHKDSLTGH